MQCSNSVCCQLNCCLKKYVSLQLKQAILSLRTVHDPKSMLGGSVEGSKGAGPLRLQQTPLQQQKLPSRPSAILSYTNAWPLQLKQAILSLRTVHDPKSGAGWPADGSRAVGPLEAVTTTSAAAETQVLLDKLKEEEEALQQKVAVLDAQLQYEQVSLLGNDNSLNSIAMITPTTECACETVMFCSTNILVCLQQ